MKLSLSKVLLIISFAFVVFIFEKNYRNVLSTPVSYWDLGPPADCGVVLTGGKGRVRAGLMLLRQGQIQRLIISGVNPVTQYEDLLEWPDWIWGKGVDPIVLEKQSQTTFGNAQQSWPLIDALKCQSVYLVTSEVHMYRAYLTFLAQKTNPYISLHPKAVTAPENEKTFLSIFYEVIKTIFYSAWVF